MSDVIYSTEEWDEVREALASIDSVKELDWRYREFQGVSPMGESFESLSTDEVLKRIDGYKVRDMAVIEPEEEVREEMIVRYDNSETRIEIIPDDPGIKRFSEYFG